MRIRPTTGADLDRVLACPVNEPASLVLPGRYRDELHRRPYRPEWTWIAADAGRIPARWTWWGFGDAAYPIILDCVYAGSSLSPGSSLSARPGTGRAARAAVLAEPPG